MKDEKLIVRLATSNDKDEILELLNKGFENQQKTASKGRDYNFWEWKYLNSNFGEAIIHVIENDNEILAFGTLWPFKFKFSGKTLNAFQPCDTIVKEKARGKGLFRKLNEARIEYAKRNNVDFLFNFPNGNSLQGYLKMGWELVDKLNWQVKILKPLQLLKNFKSNTQSVRISVLEKYIFDLVKIQKSLENNFQSKSLCSLNDSISYYRYRYENHPSRSYGLIEYSSKGETSVAIFTLTQKNELKEMILMEVIASKKTYLNLINKVIIEAKSMRVGYIVMVSQQNHESWKLLMKGFIPRRNKNFVYLPINKQFHKKLIHMENWNLFAGIHDSI
jgi:predicted N-acetyltransferase YhbS